MAVEHGRLLVLKFRPSVQIARARYLARYLLTSRMWDNSLLLSPISHRVGVLRCLGQSFLKKYLRTPLHGASR
jgi:hypothetical protein